jgi:hypothetical protein
MDLGSGENLSRIRGSKKHRNPSQDPQYRDFEHSFFVCKIRQNLFLFIKQDVNDDDLCAKNHNFLSLTVKKGVIATL